MKEEIKKKKLMKEENKKKNLISEENENQNQCRKNQRRNMFQREGEVGLENIWGRQKDKVIQFEPRWTRARAARLKEEEQAGKDEDAHIEELIKTNQTEVLIKTDQQKWDACLIKPETLM